MWSRKGFNLFNDDPADRFLNASALSSRQKVPEVRLRQISVRYASKINIMMKTNERGKDTSLTKDFP